MTSLPLDAPAISHPLPKLVLAAAVAFLGDRLFYDHPLGISLVLFLALIGIAALVTGWTRIRRRDLTAALVLLIVGLAPLVETVGFLSVMLGIVGLALSVAVLTGGLNRRTGAIVAAASGILLTGPFDLPPDVYRVARRAMSTRRAPRVATLIGWGVPIALCVVFAGLFSAANPLIEGWISGIPWSALIPGFDLPRILSWLMLLAIVWAFVAPRAGGRAKLAGKADPHAAESTVAIAPSALLRPSMVLRCLVLFNLLFAVQSATDVAYLWAGFALPPGVTHAAYAHRGAYPLVATALLAAAFVLAALRSGEAGERSHLIRVLVCVWIVQNVLLVASAMRRLDLYVEAYGLSILRLAALIWMALIAVGLALILARIALQRSNVWLVQANLLALATTLYACAFVNFAGTVTDYNAERWSRTGQAFDLLYAMNLGAEAIPAVDRVLTGYDGVLIEDARRWRRRWARDLRERMGDWRAWTFRDQRLLDYLGAHPDAPSRAR
ncbi:DUF4173 domain-containing protein [Methylobacterium sp. SI9]|uniref:DUF4153 domain-containing protein n=1 Tax=Methylobacterium guangdongense TaxID=3138811 RepID=UPI00313A7E19